MADKEFEGRTALVTGGSRGIGRAICERLASGGANVAINYQHNEPAARETSESVTALGVKALIIQGNVSEPSEVTAMVEDGIV